jgi:DNA repair protein RecO (recombination protein O)
VPLRKSPAVVVRTLDYGEADRIVTFVTPDAGRLTGIAKGARKSRRRFGAALELFTFVQLTYFEKPTFELVRLESADIVAAFPDLRRDLTRIAHAAYVVELAGRAVQPREPAFRLFRLMVEALGDLDREPADDTRLRAFELRLLSLLGYRPELRRCARCGRLRPSEGRFRVSLQAGGLLCRSCSGDPQWDGAGLAADAAPRGPAAARGLDGLSDFVTVSGRLLDRMADLLEAEGEAPPPLTLDPEEAAEARALLPRFVSAHLGAEAKALGFIDRVAGSGAGAPRA